MVFFDAFHLSATLPAAIFMLNFCNMRTKPAFEFVVYGEVADCLGRLLDGAGMPRELHEMTIDEAHGATLVTSQVTACNHAYQKQPTTQNLLAIQKIMTRIY